MYNLFEKGASESDVAESNIQITRQVVQEHMLRLGDIGLPSTIKRELAIAYAAINRCVTLVGSSIASMPLEMWSNPHRQGEGGRSHRLDESDYYRLFAPYSLIDGVQCWTDAFSTVLIDALLMGNGYFKIEKDERGRVIGLIPLHASCMSIRYGSRGRGYMANFIYRYEDGISKHMWMPSEIVHIRMPQLHDRSSSTNRFSARGTGNINADAELKGTSPLVALANQLDIGVAAEEFVAAFFASAPSTSFISSPNVLTEAQKSDITKLITELQEGGKATRRLPLVLSGGAEYKQVDSTPQSATLGQLRDQNARDVCKVYGVPPVMLGDDSQSTSWGTGITALMRGFHRTAIQPLASTIEAQLTAKISKGRVLFRFDHSAMTRESQKDEVEMMLKLVGSNNHPAIASLEEARAFIGLPPVNENDTFFEPQQFSKGDDSAEGDDKGKEKDKEKGGKSDSVTTDEDKNKD